MKQHMGWAMLLMLCACASAGPRGRIGQARREVDCNTPASRADIATLRQALALRRNARPAFAGQMTREAAKAKRLFDSERWAQAAAAMERVKSGVTHDDLGNRQIAAFHLAISLYSMRQTGRALDEFGAVAMTPAHRKQWDALPWLLELDRAWASGVPDGFFANFDPDGLLRGNRTPSFPHAASRIGRAKLLLGEYEQAARLFAALPASHATRRCQQMARDRLGQLPALQQR